MDALQRQPVVRADADNPPPAQPPPHAHAHASLLQRQAHHVARRAGDWARQPPGSPISVDLIVYDVVAQPGEPSRLPMINSQLRGLGLGGVFHGAISLGGCEEWSFGYCEPQAGTGVYSVPTGANPMYAYREALPLGATPLGAQEVAALIERLKREWPGAGYELLTRNCCHFCEEMARELRVQPVPGWLNRLAGGAAAVASGAAATAQAVQAASAEVARLSGQAATAVRARLQQAAAAAAAAAAASAGAGAGAGGQQQLQQQGNGHASPHRSASETDASGSRRWPSPGGFNGGDGGGSPVRPVASAGDIAAAAGAGLMAMRAATGRLVAHAQAAAAAAAAAARQQGDAGAAAAGGAGGAGGGGLAGVARWLPVGVQARPPHSE